MNGCGGTCWSDELSKREREYDKDDTGDDGFGVYEERQIEREEKA